VSAVVRLLYTLVCASMFQFLLVLLAATFCCIGTFVAIRVPFVGWGWPEHIQTMQPLYGVGGLVFGSQIVSGQMMALWITVLMLNQRQASLAVVLYLALGIGGVCVFSGGGGFGYLHKTTLGYLLALWLAVMAMGTYPRRTQFGAVWYGLAWGTFVVYGTGLAYEGLHMLTMAEQPVAWKVWGSYVRETLLVVMVGQLALMTVVAFVGTGVNHVREWIRTGARGHKTGRLARAVDGSTAQGIQDPVF
jgi:biotin transport system substrate-specific component